MAETFRNVRTNVLYMMRSDEKVILVTSTTTGEGKTFIASNLAVSLALLGKKIVIVGLDIRKPSLNKAFNLSHREQGISQFLANPEHTDLMSLVQVSRINANLSILPGGLFLPTPTELVARESLPQAIDILKKHFDYIILGYRPHRHGDRYPADFARSQRQHLCVPGRLHPQGRLYFNQRTGRTEKKTAQPMYHYQRTGHEEKKVRILLWIRQVWQVLRIW